MRLHWMWLITLLPTGWLHAAEQIALSDDQPVSFQIPAGQFTNDFYVDVPAGTRKLRIELDGTPRNGTDIDMFVRYQTPFPDRNSYAALPQSADAAFQWLSDHAHYQSISSGNVENVVIGEHGLRPITAGRWHIAIVNFSAQPVDATLSADLRAEEGPSTASVGVRFDLGCTAPDGPNCVCDLAPWNSTAPPVAASGNPGATLGEQRRLAALDAVNRIAAGFRSEAPITVRACWASLPVDESSAVLAQAGPEGIFINDASLFDGSGRPGLRQTFLPESHAWYAAAPSSKLAGTSFCRIAGGPCASRIDVTITFNSQIDTTRPFGSGFYYGLNAPPPGAIDFIGIAMHEISHGLGFLSLVDVGDTAQTGGEEFVGRDDIYARQLVDTRSGQPRAFTRLTDAERRAAMTSGNKLQWIEAEAVNSPFNRERAGEIGVRIFAPGTQRPGSTLSHIDQFYRGDLMVPSSSAQEGNRELKLTQPMLNAVGWRSEPTQMPEYPAPLSGQWYDRDRVGHGIDFQRVFRDSQGQEIYSLIFYSYDRDGLPEWFLAIGPLVDGVFLADVNEFGDSLVSYLYDAARSPPQRADGARRGQVRLDFNQPTDSAACGDGTNRDESQPLAVFAWSLEGDVGNWCVEPLIAAGGRPALDLTGTWYGGQADQGWGVSVATAGRGDDSQLLFALLYYPDAQGKGRWGFVQAENYLPGQPLEFIQRRGYCRTCPSTPFVDEVSGSFTPELVQPTQEDIAGPNRLGFSVQFLGPAGGSFVRPAQTPLTLLSAPAPQGE